MRAALGVVLLVACNDVHGVAVLVHPNNPDVHYVRLFVGTGGSVMTDLTPDSGVTAGSAYYTVRDPSNACDACDVIASTTQVAKFGFVTEAPIPVVIAVGYDAQKQPLVAGVAHDLAPSDQSNDFFGYDLDLAPFQAFSKTSTTALQLDLWSPPDVAKDPFTAACAGIIDPNADHPYFVIREDDQDCDGLDDGTPGECTPDFYLGSAPPDPADATCLVEETNVKCRLGGRGCVDNGGMAPACSPSNTCLPTNLCTECMDNYKCAAEILSSTSVNPTATAHYSCIVHVDAGGAACSEVVPLDRPPTGGLDCLGVQIADASTQLTDKITQDNVEMTISELQDLSCAATLTFQGTPMSSADSLSAMVDFTLKNNAGIAMPVTVTFQGGGCVPAVPCVLTHRAFDDATQTACATGWTGPPVQVDLPPTGASDTSDPTLTSDQKQMFFESGGMIFEATRATNNGAWTSVVPATITVNATNRAPELSANGLSIVLVSTDVVAMTNLYTATRASTTVTFGPATSIVGVDSQVVFTSATFAPDDAIGTHRMIAAGIPSAGVGTLYDLVIDPTMHTIMQQTPIVLAATNLDHPHLTPDGLELYFDGSSNGKTTIWVASRRTVAEPFTEAVQLLELDDAADAANYSGAPWVGAGGRTMYYTHAITGVKHILQTTRAVF